MAGDFMQGDRDNAIQVPFSDDDSADKPEELLDDDSPTATSEERVLRSQKRKERITRLLNEGKQSKEEAAALRAEQAELKTRLAQLEGAVAVSTRPAAPPPGVDPYEARLAAVYDKQNNAYQAAQAEIKAGTFDEKRQRHYEGVAREIESEKGAIHAERTLARHEPVRQQEQARQHWVQKYPDVYRNPNAYQYAEGRFKQRRALGEADSEALVDEVMAETLATFKLGPKKAPSASDRSRLSGIAASGSGGGSRADGGIQMTPELRRMAIAAHPDLSEADALKKWANGPGKRLREKKVI